MTIHTIRTRASFKPTGSCLNQGNGETWSPLCLRTQSNCHKPMCHNELRSISRISQAVCIRSQTRSQPAPSNQSFPNTTVNGPPQAHAWALTPWLVCRPGCRLGWPCCPEGSSGSLKHGATLCLRTQVKCHKPICHNELRSNFFGDNYSSP